MAETVFSGLTVNYHFTQRCNMACRYCFVSRQPELSLEEYKVIIEKLSRKFDRINFVGGEPTVSKELPLLMKFARQSGLKVTMVTNGLRMALDESYAELILSNLDGIGLSIDSLDQNTNLKIGRAYKGMTLTKDQYLAFCKKIKAHNLELKINTVVSSANLGEDFTGFYAEAKPDRIKHFQVLKTNLPLKRNYDEFLITHEEYRNFVKRHEDKGFEIVAEDNNHMIGSYIMVNSKGCFENSETGKLSTTLLTKGLTAEQALAEVNIDMDKYNYRYEKSA